MSEHRITLGGSGLDVNKLPAIIDGDISLSYLDYHQLIAATTQKLKAQGIQRDQRVAVIADNSTDYIVTVMALLHLGAVACPVSTRYPSDTIENTLRSINCQAAIAASEYVFESRAIRWIPMCDASGLKNADSSLDELTMEQDATILFTSGTTTTPKAVLHTFGNHYYSAVGSNLNIVLHPGDRWLLSLPLYHVGGLGIVFRCLVAGGTVVIGPSGQNVASAIGKYDITHLSLVATQFQALLKEWPSKKLPEHLKAVLVGGGFVPRRLIEKAAASGWPAHTTYGSTEMASQVTTTCPGESLEKLFTSGKALKYRQLRLSDEGEILVKGETLFRGYVAEAGVNTPFDSDGWYATGDLGKLDSEGYLTVTGRKDNMFISGGENIYPEEIEAAIRLSEGVEDAIVVPVDDSRYGQRPVAFVKLSKTAQPDTEKLKDDLLERLPKFKVPVRILPWPDDMSQTGIKPDRSYFRKLVEESCD